MAQRYFVTGTDTGVGKTFASCAMLESANRQGLSTMALKPVAAGCEELDGMLKNEDAIALMQHMSMTLPYEQVNPVTLKAATSPHIAAALDNKMPTISRLQGFCQGALMKRPDFALVEGAGGWRVPLNKRETLADFAKLLDFPVILVVGMRLGCINHALLSAEAIARDGLKLAGWIANRPQPEAMDYEGEYLATLKGSISAPLLGVLPYSKDSSPVSVSGVLDLSLL